MYAPARKPKISSFCQVIAHFVHPEDIAAFAISAGTLNVISYPPYAYAGLSTIQAMISVEISDGWHP
jgi:hypothetical protein